MRDADDIQVSRIDLHSNLFSAFSSGGTSNRFAAIKMSARRAVASVFEASVAPSQQEN